MTSHHQQPRTWLETVERARSFLQEQEPSGQSMRAQHDAAARLGVRTTTLRSYLNAWSKIEEMAAVDQDCAATLRRLPVDAVRAIGRWTRFDLIGAIEFLRQHPEVSAGEARKAEQSARRKVKVSEPSFWEKSIAAKHQVDPQLQLKGSIANHFWHSGNQFLPELPGIYERYLGSFEYRGTSNSYERDLGLDGAAWLDPRNVAERDRDEIFRYRDGHFQPSAEHGYGLCAVMKMAHFGVPEFYRREAKSLQYRAILAAELYPLVLLPLPTTEARDEVIKGLSSLPQEKFYNDQGRKSGPLPGYLDRSEPHLIFSGPNRGVVVITSASTMISDLFDPYR